MSKKNVIITTRWTEHDIERIDWMRRNLMGSGGDPATRTEVIRAAVHVLFARLRAERRDVA